MMSDASEMLAAALEQMDGIIAGSKAMDYSNGLFDCQSPTSPFLGGLRVLHLLEDLRAALELMDNEEKDNLRCQIPDSTAEGVAEWLHGRMTNGHGSEAVYQERLSRLESDKECLILQERRIKELEESLTKCKKVQELVKEKLKEDDYDDIPDDPSLPVAMEVDQVTLPLEGEAGRSSGESIPCIAVLSEMNELDRERQLQAAESSSDVPQPGSTDQTKDKARSGSSSPKANATNDDSFGTKKARASFGRGFFKLRGGKQTASAPNLAETDRKGTDHLDLAGAPSRKSQDGAPPSSSPETKKKSKGFKKFFGRLKRSHSTSFNLDDAAEMEFRRGGVRATAGPRLGWSRELKNNAVDVPFSRWSKDEVSEWMHEQGLGLYVAQGQSWIKSGQTLLQASQHDLEKVLEPRFNVESLALLLNIPPNKTLLRRHLATHFHLLIGSEAQRLKQDCLENPDYTVLTATAKVKPRRLSFGGFSTLRKKRHDDSEEYVCPLNVEMPKSSSFQRGVRIYEENFDHLEQMEDSEGTVRQIGAFSEGINNLTSMLKEDELFQEVSVCPPEVHVAETDANSNI
eukprot:superscaffoldBa00001702_g11686